MNRLSALSSVLCSCALLCSVISLLMPQNRMKKPVNLVLSLFLICSLILPIKETVSGLSLDIDMKEDWENAEFSQEELDKAVLKETADNLVSVADNLLKNEGIKARDIRLSLKISDDRSIYISSVLIYISKDDKERASDVKRIIYGNFSKEPQIIIEQG